MRKYLRVLTSRCKDGRQGMLLYENAAPGDFDNLTSD
jgi:hypothetical protein